MSKVDIHSEVGYYRNKHGRAAFFTVADPKLMARWQESLDLYGAYDHKYQERKRETLQSEVENAST